jgi:hypothetical protein
VTATAREGIDIVSVPSTYLASEAQILFALLRKEKEVLGWKNNDGKRTTHLPSRRVQQQQQQQRHEQHQVLDT